MSNRNSLTDIKGAKAGSKPKKPYRAKAAATTQQKMRITYGLTEGVALGFGRNYSLSDMLKRIYLDGTPIMSEQGDKLLDVYVEFRDGSRDQTVISGLPSVTVENPINVEVTHSSPISREFSRVETTAYDVRVSVPQLFSGDDEGNQRKGLIQFKVEVTDSSGNVLASKSYEINERIINGWSSTYTVEVPSAAQHVVKVIRTNSDVVNEFSASTLILESIVEVTNVQLRYPNTALLYLEYDAEQFSNIPKLEVKLYGKADLRIPANYDPETRTYATTGAGTTNGVWNGEFKLGYTDNPVWIWLDLVVSKRYGLGDKVTLDMVDKWQLYAISQYCDQLVSDGNGGQEPRFTCNNLYLQKSEDAFKVLKDIASIFRSTTVWTGERFTALADMPRDPVMTFSAANAKEIIYSSVDASAQHNLVNVQYYDKTNKFTSRVTMKRDKDNILRRDKIVDVQFTATGCTSEGQAQRAAKYTLVSELNETELVSFTTGLEGALLRLNDVFYLADDAVAGRITSGRLVAVNGNTATLDRPVPENIALGGATKLVVNRSDVTTSPVDVIGVDSTRTVVELSAPLPATTGKNLVWALITQDVVPQQFRVTDIKFNEDDLNYSISGVTYNKSKYAAIDGDARIVNPPISIVEQTLLQSPAQVTATYNVRIDQGINVSDCYVAWSQSNNAIAYQVEMQKDFDEWRIIGKFTSLATTLENMYNGVYAFRVCAIDALGNMSQYTTSTALNIAGKVLPPPVITAYSVAGILFGFQHDWAYPAHTEDSRSVRIRKALINPALNVAQPYFTYDVAYPANTYVETNVAANTTAWFSIAIIDKYGTEGAYSNWVQATVDSSPDKILDIISGYIDESTLGIALQQRLDTMGTDLDATETLATQAKTAADNATIKAQEAADAVTQEAIDRAAALQAGISQVTTNYIAADSVIYGELNAYKASNDSAVATAVQKAESAVATGATNSQSITELTGQVQTINNTKLDASVIANYYTKGQTDAKADEIAAGKIESYDANLVIGGANLLLNSDFSGAANWDKWGDNGGGYTKVNDPIYGAVLQTQLPNGLVHAWLKLDNNVEYTYSALVKSSSDLYPNGNVPLHYWAGKDNQSQNKIHVLSYSPTLIEAEKWTRINIVFKLVDDADSFRPFIFGLNGVLQLAWTKLERGNKATDWTPNGMEMQHSINANASAIQTTSAEVSRINGEVTSQASSISSLQSSLSDVDTKANTAINNAATAQQAANTAVTTADATAVIAQNLQASLDNTNANIATNYYTKSSTDQAIAFASNQLSSSFNTAINAVGGIDDTRYDNQPPSWYWTNYPQRTKKEFKFFSVLGIPQATSDLFGVLETVVPWNDSTGGPIQQRFTWSDSAYALTRYSISDSSWSAWVSALNEVKNTVNTKLDASVISNYYTKAEADSAIAGKVEQFSSSVYTSNENLFKGNILYVPKAYAPGISSFNYSDFWVIDANSGNSNWISLDLGVSSQTMNYNGLYSGPVTVSMDYMMESGNSEALPAMYFGHGYQPFVHSKKGPHALYTWYRIYTTFYTDANTLLSSPHLGVGGIAGRICIRNLKIERGGMTTYSVDVRDTTQSINGIQAIKTVTIDNNGVMSGYGLISELKNGQVTSSFGINADTFYIGAPSGGRKMFVSTTTPQVINGVQYPAGTWIDVGNIANATIGIAHLNQATINHLMAGTVETVGADGARRVISGSVDRLYAPNGTLVLEIGLLS